MDMFYDLMDQSIALNKFCPFKQSNYSISHLLFIDEVMVIDETSLDFAFALKQVMSNFFVFTGLKSNLDKSYFHFVRDYAIIHQFGNLLNFSIGHFPIKYLGIPLLNGVDRAIHFNGLWDKIYAWLSGWKSKLLSLGGRFQLTRSSINGDLCY